jgi:hypothetical protein
MASMESPRGKYPRLRWFALAQVIAVLLLSPSEYRDEIRDHANPIAIGLATLIGLAWNGMLLKLWWETRPFPKEDSQPQT